MAIEIKTAHLWARGAVLYIDVRLNGPPWRIQKSTGFRLSQESEATAALAAARRQIEAGLRVRANPGSTTVKAWAEEWIGQRRARGVLSWPSEKRRLERHLVPTIGRQRVADVTKTEMLKWVHDLPAQPREDG